MRFQKSCPGNDRRRGIALLVTAAMSAVVVPMIGLSIDVGIMYVVKTKLSAAADAAAIAGARSLSRGVDFNAQKGSAIATASNYFRANFPDGYFLTTASSITTDVTTSGTNLRIVASTATATVPTYFLRFLPNTPPGVTVNVAATATRRDSNVILVLDRSRSLDLPGTNLATSSCGVMRASASGFIDKFSETRDYLGMVTFGTSSYYMDYPVSTTFKSGATPLTTMIGNITCTGYTSTAHGLWNGYTALANLNQPGALNVIVLFTDGQPTAVPATYHIINPGSPCSNKSNRNAVIASVGTPNGLMNLVNGPVSVANDQALYNTNPPGTAGCNFASNQTNVDNDVVNIPATDFFGDNTNTGYAGPVSGITDTSVTNAATNAADEAAKHIRNGDAITAMTLGAPAGSVGKSLSNVLIFSIGLGSAATPPDQDFLMRVANAPGSSIHDASKQDGVYVWAATAADLSDAFERVAAEILRLSK